MAEQGPDVKPQGNRQGADAPATDARRARAGVGEAEPVRIYAETYSPPFAESDSQVDSSILWGRTDDDTGEIKPFELVRGKIVPAGRDSRTARAERFVLKAAARRLLPKDHRTTKCMHWRLPNMETQVLKGATKGKAFYHGLQVCAMPWTCPVCASKISERRRHEVAKAIKQAEALGLQVFLLTLTIPHGIGDDVADMLNKMTKAWTSLWQGKAGMKLRESLGLFGHIRALETTYGQNGFHPHFHALLFFHPQQTSGAGWGSLGPRWQKACVKAGLPMPDLAHGCRIDGGDKAANYVSKGVWGLESEVTKGHIKSGRKDSRTPFDLLRDYVAGDKQAGAIWRSYVDAFQGRRQLYWSNGLKKLLAIAELSDEEIANKPEEEPALLLATITDEQWRIIFRRHLESTILDLAEVSPDAMRLFIQGLKEDS